MKKSVKTKPEFSWSRPNKDGMYRATIRGKLAAEFERAGNQLGIEPGQLLTDVVRSIGKRGAR